MEFLYYLKHYCLEIFPALALGFFISGLVHELLPSEIAERYLNKRGILPILYVTFIGILLPVCCFGSLPIAITFRKKGMRLGPILAFLVATPATSITSILVSLKFFGLFFTVYLCISVIVLGVLIGLIGNLIKSPEVKDMQDGCPMCQECNHNHHKKGLLKRIASIFSYGFIDLPKEIGLEIIIGLILSALVSSISLIGNLIKTYLVGIPSYIFALFFGLLMYICSTASVPLAHSLVQQGLNTGAAIVLLIAGPVTSYGAILVLHKEFGIRVLLLYLFVISIVSILSGAMFNFFQIIDFTNVFMVE